MDILAHALWAGAGVALARRRWPLSPRTAALTVAQAVLPDIPHMVPILGWSVFGDGSLAAAHGYAVAVAGQLPTAPPAIDAWSHNLYCTLHSAVVAGILTMLSWLYLRALWIPLLGWWSHIVIDVFTHSADYYPVPVLYPFTQSGFDGVAWNEPWFMALNYTALAVTYLWLWRTWRGARKTRAL